MVRLQAPSRRMNGEKKETTVLDSLHYRCRSSAIMMILLATVASLSPAARMGNHADAKNRYVAVTGVDWTNDGSRLHPWRTLEYAGNLATPGTTIHVLPGTYAVSRIIVTHARGTEKERIRYVSEERWGAKIVTSASQGWMNTGDYVDIEGFDVSSTSLVTYIGIHSQGSYDRILYNHIHDLHAPPGTCPQGGGIMMGDPRTVGQEAEGNMVHDIGPPPGQCKFIHGIYSSTPHCKVTNNLIFDNSGVGVHLWGHPDHCLIANNTIFGNGRGLVVGGDPKSGVNDFTVVANNIVYRNREVGIYEAGLTGLNNRYIRNLSCGNKVDWSLRTGTQFNSIAADPQFVRNTGTIDGDYHLKSNSPGVGTADPRLAPPTDFDGNRRGSTPNLGAYEAQQMGRSAER